MCLPEPTVFVVEDDPEVRRSLCWLVSKTNLPVLGFPSALEFLEAVPPDQTGCAIVDVCLPGMSGLELQATIRERYIDLPVIVITGHGSTETAERARAAGALGYMEKPLDDKRLLELVAKGIKGKPRESVVPTR